MTERDKALNDLIDVVASLTLIVEELNPGASEQIRRIRFLIGRAEDCVNRAMMEPSKPKEFWTQGQ